MEKNNSILTLASFITIGSLFLMLGGCVVTAQQKMLDAGMKPLTDQEIQTLFSQPTNTSYEMINGKKGTIQHFPDGTQKLTNLAGTFEDEGTWRVKNGQICGTWKIIRNGVEQCESMFKIEENKYKIFKPNGEFMEVLTFH